MGCSCWILASGTIEVLISSSSKSNTVCFCSWTLYLHVRVARWTAVIPCSSVRSKSAFTLIASTHLSNLISRIDWTVPSSWIYYKFNPNCKVVNWHLFPTAVPKVQGFQRSKRVDSNNETAPMWKRNFHHKRSLSFHESPWSRDDWRILGFSHTTLIWWLWVQSFRKNGVPVLAIRHTHFKVWAEELAGWHGQCTNHCFDLCFVWGDLHLQSNMAKDVQFMTRSSQWKKSNWRESQVSHLELWSGSWKSLCHEWQWDFHLSLSSFPGSRIIGSLQAAHRLLNLKNQSGKWEWAIVISTFVRHFLCWFLWISAWHNSCIIFLLTSIELYHKIEI